MRPTLIICAALLIPGIAGATPPLLSPVKIQPMEGSQGTIIKATEDSAQCKIRFVQAIKPKGQDDERLAPIRKTLGRVAKGYGSFKLMSQTDLTIPQGKSRSADVPNGSKMNITYVEQLLESGKKKLRLQILMPPRIKKSTVTLSSGGTWPLIVIEGFKGGALVIALTCHAK